MIIKQAIGTRLSKIRNERGETQEQVAKSIGISYVSLSRYETGQREPKMNILAKLAEHYEVTIDNLINGEESPTKNEPANNSGFSAAVIQLYNAIAEADLSDDEASFLRAQIEGLKALRKS